MEDKVASQKRPLSCESSPESSAKRHNSKQSNGQDATVPAQATLSSLIDDCLVPVLVPLPFTEQINTLPVTCTRWNSLITLVHQKRTKLVVYNFESTPVWFNRFRHLFNYPSPIFSLSFSQYLNSLFNDDNRDNLDALSPDFFKRSIRLDERLVQQFELSFPNLTDLSLVSVLVTPETLRRLLSPLRVQIQSLFLQPEYHLDGDDQETLNSLQQLLSVIDTMYKLGQLALCSILPVGIHLDLALSLANVLNQLTEFQFCAYTGLVFPLLMCLDDSKLKRLHLDDTVWTTELSFSQLVERKPGLKDLKYLTFGSFQLTEPVNEELLHIDDLQLNQIVSQFKQLRNLAISSMIPFTALAQNLCKLPHLTHFKLISLSTSPLESLSELSFRELQKYKMKELKSLTFHDAKFEIEHLSVLSKIVPKLSQIYLDNSTFYCHCKAIDVEDETDEEDDGEFEMEEVEGNELNDVNEDEELEDEDDEEGNENDVLLHLNLTESFQLPGERPTGCTCKYKLMAALASFADLPKLIISYDESQ